MRTRTIRSFVSLTAGLGLIASIYAELETLEVGLRSSCTLNSFFSCAAVDASGRTTTLGIPDALIGVAGFLLILALAVLAEQHRGDLRYLTALLVVTTGGVAFASYFAYVELEEIHALCPVCTTAYLFGAFAWIGAIALTGRALRTARSEQLPASESPAAPKSPA